jgi:hypothetical protein
MGWFSLKRTPTTAPVYSELGTEIYRLLEEKEGEWVYYGYYAWDRQKGLEHRPANIWIEFWSSKGGTSICIRERQNADGVPTLDRLITPDDHSRIRRRAIEIKDRYIDRRQYEDMKQALEKLKPNPFDSTCRELARQVLSGDPSACRPLIDKALECLQG